MDLLASCKLPMELRLSEFVNNYHSIHLSCIILVRLKIAIEIILCQSRLIDGTAILA